MAYRHAGGPYRQRGLGAEHPRTSHQNTAATSFNSYESVGASIYHPHLSQSRERRSSVPFSEHAHGPGFPQREQLPPVLAAGGRESVDGRARGEKQPYQESNIYGDFNSAQQTYAHEKYHYEQQNMSYSEGSHTRPAFDYRDRLTDSVGSHGPVTSQRGAQEFESSNFSLGDVYKSNPQTPLMQPGSCRVGDGSVSLSRFESMQPGSCRVGDGSVSLSRFENRSRSLDSDTSKQFQTCVSDVRHEPSGTGWPNDSWNGQRTEPHSEAWQQSQTKHFPSHNNKGIYQQNIHRESAHFSEPISHTNSPGQYERIDSGHREGGNQLGCYSESSLMGSYAQHREGGNQLGCYSEMGSYGQHRDGANTGRSRQRSNSLDKMSYSSTMSSGRMGGSKRHPPKKPKGRARGRGSPYSLNIPPEHRNTQPHRNVGPDTRLSGSKHAPKPPLRQVGPESRLSGSKHAPKPPLRQVGPESRLSGSKHAPKPPLRQSSLEHDRLASSKAKWTKSSSAATSKNEQREKTTNSTATQRNFLTAEVFTRRSLHEPNRGYDSDKSSLVVRSPSPRTIQERLGPHVPGSDSVQNRLGPPKEERTGVHSRLGPEESSDPHLECVQSRLGPEESMTHASDNIQFRLGPEETLSNSFSSSNSIHSRLGPEEINDDPLGSSSLLVTTTDSVLPSTSVHSRLGPEENNNSPLGTHSFFGGSRISDSDNVLSRLGPEETFGHSLKLPLIDGPSPLPSITSRLGPEDKNLDGSLGSELIHSRLGPDEKFNNEEVRFRLGPEIPSQISHLKSESRYSNDMPPPKPLQSYPEIFSEETPRADYHQQSSLFSMIKVEGQSSLPPITDMMSSSSHFDTVPPSSYEHQATHTTIPDAGLPLNEQLDYRHTHSDRSPLSKSPRVSSDSHSGDADRSDLHLTSIQWDSLSTSQQPSSQANDITLSCAVGTKETVSTAPSPSGTSNKSIKSTRGCSNSDKLGSSNLKSTHSTTSVKSRSETRRVVQVKQEASPSQKQKKISSEPSSKVSKLSPTSSKKISLCEGSHIVETKQRTSSKTSKLKSSPCTSASQHTNSAPNVGKSGTNKTEKLPASPTKQASSSQLIGQSIPTLIKKRAVSTVLKRTSQKSTPSKDVPKLEKSTKTLDKPAKKPEKNTVCSSEHEIGHKDDGHEAVTYLHLTEGKNSLTASPTRDTSTNISNEVLESTGSTEQKESVSLTSIEMQQSEPEAVQLKVGVASVVSFERQMEEGEVTDSETEDLVIDLDNSYNSTTTPSKSQKHDNHSPGKKDELASVENLSKKVNNNVDEKSCREAENLSGSEREENKTVHAVPKNTDDAPMKIDVVSDDQNHVKTTSVEDVPKDNQETKFVSNDDQKMVVVVCQQPKTIPKDHKQTEVVANPVHCNSRMPTIEPNISYRRLTVKGLVRKAQVILGIGLATTLNNTPSNNPGSPSILNLIRIASAKQSEILRHMFHRKHHRQDINVDFFISYVQMKLPECAIGKASVMKLAFLMAVDSCTFFHCDLIELYDHGSRDVEKWRLLGLKYYNSVAKFMTISQMKIYFPTNLYPRFNWIVGASVLATCNIPKKHRKLLSYRDVQKHAGIGLTFLEEARNTHGPFFIQALGEIDQRVSTAEKNEVTGTSFADDMLEGSNTNCSTGSSTECALAVSSTLLGMNRQISVESMDDFTVEDMVIVDDDEDEAAEQITPLSSEFTSLPASSQSSASSLTTSVTVTMTDSNSNQPTTNLSDLAIPPSDLCVQSSTVDTLTYKSSSDHSPPVTANETLSSSLTALESPKPLMPAKPPQRTSSQSQIGEECSPHVDNKSNDSVPVADTKEVGKNETENKQEVDDMETISISSGEILSSPNPSPKGKLNDCEEKDKFASDRFSNDDKHKESSLQRPSEWRSRRYFPLGAPPAHHRVIPATWGTRFQRDYWKGNQGGWKSGPRDDMRRMSRSISRSPSPSANRRDRFSKFSHRRHSSPEDYAPRRYMRSSLSPDLNSRNFGKAYSAWKRRKTTDGSRHSRCKRTRSSRSCDRTSDKNIAESSDEDLEVLELRKEALISMLDEGRTLKNSHEDKHSVADTIEKGEVGDSARQGEKEGMGDNARQGEKKDGPNSGNQGEGEVIDVEKDRTLVEEDVNAVGKNIVQMVKKETGGEKVMEVEKMDDQSLDSKKMNRMETGQNGTESNKNGKEMCLTTTNLEAIVVPTSPQKPQSSVPEDRQDANVVKTIPEVCMGSSVPSISHVANDENSSQTSFNKPPSPKLSSMKQQIASSVPFIARSASPTKPLEISSKNTTTTTAPVEIVSQNTQNTTLTIPSGSKGKLSTQQAKVISSNSAAKSSISPVVKAVASRSSSGSASRVGSPVSSRGSPAPPIFSGIETSGSGMETGSMSRRGADITHPSSKPPTSVKVVPSSKGTWEIPAFHIQLAESEDEDEQQNETEGDSSGDGVNYAHRPPTIDEIDSVLGQFRRDAEAKAKSKEKTTAHSPERSPVPSTKCEPNQTTSEIASSRRVDLSKPAQALEMLPLKVQREYLELRTRLALHEKRKREEEMAGKGKDKGKRPLNVVTSKKGKNTPVKPVENQTSNSAASHATIVETDRDILKRPQMTKETKLDLGTKDDEEQKSAADGQQRKNGEEIKIAREENENEVHGARLSAVVETVQKDKEQSECETMEEEREANLRREEVRLKKEEQSKKKERQQKFLKMKKKCEMKVAELEGKIRSCRSHNERWTKMLTSATNSMTDCETEIEEHELKIEILSKQLQMAKNCHDKCKQRKEELKDKVRDAQENISRHATIIHDTQKLLINERDLLITLESNHDNDTNIEGVTMEIESDCSKGEGEMDVVTSSDDGENIKVSKMELQSSSTLAPLVFEAVSDAETPSSLNQITSVDPGSNISVPVSGTGVSKPPPCNLDQRGKRRRMSRSERTRKSSLSQSHTAGELPSDSDTEESSNRPTKKRKQLVEKIVDPPLPLSPIPLTPPPPPLPLPSPTHTTSPSSLLSLTARCLASNQDGIPVISNPNDNKISEAVSSEESVTNTGIDSETPHTPDDKNVLLDQEIDRDNSQSLSATLPVPPIDVEFITDTDTGSESGLLASTVPVQELIPSGTRSETDSTMPIPDRKCENEISMNEKNGESISSKGDANMGPFNVITTNGTRVSGSVQLTASLADNTHENDAKQTSALSANQLAKVSTTTDESDSIMDSAQANLCDRFPEGALSNDADYVCMDTERPSEDDNASESSPVKSINNPFISMLKIAKIESLSESSDTFSPIEKHFNPTDIVMSHDIEEASCDHHDLARPCSSIQTSDPDTPNERLPIESTEIHMVESVMENPSKSSSLGSGTKLKVLVPGEKSNEKSKVSVFVTVINPPPELVSGDSGYQKRKKGGKKGVNSGNEGGRKVSKKGVNAGKALTKGAAKGTLRKKAAASGKVVKPTTGKRGVGKLPLVRSESDSVVVERNRRKSTPRRFVSKTTTSSPDWSQIKSLGAGSHTLNKALQATLDTALSPALANVFSTSKSSPISQKIEEPSPLSLNLDETLRQTLHHALSPVLESVLSPSSFSNLMGHSCQTDSSLGSRADHDVGPSVDSEAMELSCLVGPPVPLLDTVPRSVPSIPFEICSSGLEVSIVRWLVQERFTSESGNQASTSMETSDIESSGNELYTSDENTTSTKCSGMKTSDSGSMEISQNETTTVKKTSSSFAQSKAAKAVRSLHSNSQPLASSMVRQKASPSQPLSSKSKVKGKRLHKVAPSDKSKANLKPEVSNADVCAPSEPITLEGLLSKIKQVKTNLEKQVTGKLVLATKLLAELPATKPVKPVVSQAQVRSSAQSIPGKQGPPLTQSFKLVPPPFKRIAMKAANLKDVAKNLQDNAKGSTPMEGSQLVAILQLPWNMAGNQLVGIVTAANVNQNVAANAESEAQGQSLPVATDMENVVKELGFRMTWKEVQESLQSSVNPLFEVLPLVTSYHYSTTTINPLVVKQSSQLNDSDVIPDSVLESLRKQAVQTDNVDISVAKHRSLRRYRPYSSPLLSFPAYRLNANYRNHEKLPLSSLSHANKIDPMRIWCRYEMFGKCSDSKCTRQHIREVTLSKAELVNDIIAYSPSLCADGTEISGSSIKSAGKVTTVLKTEKGPSYRESIMATYARKMTDEQILKLATYKVNQVRSEREGGVVKAEEIHLRQREAVEEKKVTTDNITRPPPLYIGLEETGSVETDSHVSSDGNKSYSFSGDYSDSSTKVDRYFTKQLDTTSHPPKDTSTPSHFLSQAKRAKNATKACGYLEAGLGHHPGSEELWVEYVATKSSLLVGTDHHVDREELLSKALIMCPTYAIIVKLVQTAVSVTDKASWIQRGYFAITCNKPQPPLSLSLCAVQLLLSHAYLHCISGQLDVAIATLQHALETDDKQHSKQQDNPFTDIIGHLTLPHLQLSYLVMIHIMYTSCFPQQIVLWSHTAPSLPLLLKTDTESLLLPWTKTKTMTSDKLQKIEQLLAVAITRCQYRDPSNSLETTFALYHNLVLFQLAHRSEEIAQQTLTGLLNCSSHSSRLWMLSAQIKDWTSNSKMAIEVLEKATKDHELDSNVPELYCYAAKLILKENNGCHGDVSSILTLWLRNCVCRFYTVPDSNLAELSLRDIALMYRKLLGQIVPYDYTAPSEVIRSEEASRNLPYLWVAYCVLVRVSHHCLRGNYHHSGPEETFESAVHSVNDPSHLQIVWLEYLSYLRDNALKMKNNHTAFKSFSDCVYRCLVVMDTKQSPPALLPGQPAHYHDYSFHEKVCDMFFGTLSPTSPYVLDMLTRLLHKLPDNTHLIIRLSRYGLERDHSLLDLMQSTLASFLSSHPKCLRLWQIAIKVELSLKNIREVRWMYCEAVRHFPLTYCLWKEFLLFELNQLSVQTHSPSPSLSLAYDIITRATQVGITLTPSPLSSINLKTAKLPSSA